MSSRALKVLLACVALGFVSGVVLADTKSELLAQQSKKKAQQESQQAHAKAQEALLLRQQQQTAVEETKAKRAKSQTTDSASGPLKDFSAASLPQR